MHAVRTSAEGKLRMQATNEGLPGEWLLKHCLFV